MEQTFDVDVDVTKGVPVVSVQGEIDVATAPMLRERLHHTIAESGPNVVVDLLGVTFLDSTALGVLIGALKQCREKEGNLLLAIDEPRILKVFEITRLSDVFAISSTLEGALQAAR
jgi:anti-sigma B factor antagonist